MLHFLESISHKQTILILVVNTMAGRPKRQFSDEQVQQMEEYALDGCQNTTIAILMDIGKSTLKRRFGPLLRKKRCERKQRLRLIQTNLACSNPAMAIFLGKNELNQTDKQVVETKNTSAPDLSEPERRAIADLARAYKLKLADAG